MVCAAPRQNPWRFQSPPPQQLASSIAFVYGTLISHLPARRCMYSPPVWGYVGGESWDTTINPRTRDQVGIARRVCGAPRPRPVENHQMGSIGTGGQWYKRWDSWTPAHRLTQNETYTSSSYLDLNKDKGFQCHGNHTIAWNIDIYHPTIKYIRANNTWPLRSRSHNILHPLTFCFTSTQLSSCLPPILWVVLLDQKRSPNTFKIFGPLRYSRNVSDSHVLRSTNLVML